MYKERKHGYGEGFNTTPSEAAGEEALVTFVEALRAGGLGDSCAGGGSCSCGISNCNGVSTGSET